MAKNKRPKTQMISFPAEFKPLLDKELGEKGLFTYCELMGQILAEHYGTNKAKPATRISVKEVKDE
ncbi:hypothetical protein ES707_13099 [subsurface metagenome]